MYVCCLSQVNQKLQVLDNLSHSENSILNKSEHIEISWCSIDEHLTWSDSVHAKHMLNKLRSGLAAVRKDLF